MKRTHAKLRALIKVDAENNVGALGAILETIITPCNEPPNVLANSSFNKAYGQFVFGEDFSKSDVSDLFESLLRKLPPENADDLRKLFLSAYFEGAVGAGRWLSEDYQRAIQRLGRRRGGKVAGAAKAQEAEQRWQDKALLVAQEFQGRNPNAGQVLIAKAIQRELGEKNTPKAEQIKKVVGRWQKRGKLKAIRPSSKRNREVSSANTPSK